MVKRDAQIDILFREGLLDMEVLPPSDIWDDISPAINSRSNLGIVFRIAAGFAALTTLAMLTYFIGIRTAAVLEQPLSASADLEFSDFNVPRDQVIQTLAQEHAQRNVAGSAGMEREAFASVANDIPQYEPVVQFELSDAVNEVEMAGNEMRTDLVNNNMISEKIDALEPEQLLYEEIDPLLIPPNQSLINDKWQVGAKMSPTYLSSNLMAANQLLGDLKSDESAVMSYSGGFSISYKMSGRMSLQTGIYYSSLGREISGIDSYSGFAVYAGTKSSTVFGVETSTGKISTTNKDIFLTDAASNRISGQYSADNFDPVKADLTPLGSSLRQNYEYIEIPLMLSYKLIDRKIDFNIMGGMSYNFLLNNRTYAMADGSHILIGSTDNMNALLLSSALGMSMEYNLTSKISLNLEPSFKYYLNSGGHLSIRNPYSVGVYSGFLYKF
ncbi:MAG TPA: outer membrane beta-barrel protein [Bacteroidales bacterium]|nr:outer membrane beta-barrel protein [Bacteroidales bacterium]